MTLLIALLACVPAMAAFTLLREAAVVALAILVGWSARLVIDLALRQLLIESGGH